MAIFDWKDSYSVKIKAVDEQHKILVSSLNELYEAMRNREAETVISGILKKLTDYIGIHFSFEEDLMTRHGYPDLPEHKKEHEDFVAKVSDFVEKHKAGKLMLSMEVMTFLIQWLKEHIMGSDKKYGPFLNQKGVV